jgi:hypothetical protein
MPDERRAGTQTRLIHRTLRLAEPLREAIRDRRAARGQTLAGFLAEAVWGELPGLLAALAEAGLAGGAGEWDGTRPARLPLSAELLGELKAASRASGVPACRLLMACVARSAARKRRRGGGRPGAKGGRS